MSHPATPERRYVRLPGAVDYLLRQQNIEISTDTLRRMILRGDLTGYRLPGSRLIFVDLDEIDVLMKPVDAAVAAS